MVGFVHGGANMSLDPLGDFEALAGGIVGADNVYEIVQSSKLAAVRKREIVFPALHSG